MAAAASNLSLDKGCANVAVQICVNIRHVLVRVRARLSACQCVHACTCDRVCVCVRIHVRACERMQGYVNIGSAMTTVTAEVLMLWSLVAKELQVFIVRGKRYIKSPTLVTRVSGTAPHSDRHAEQTDEEVRQSISCRP